MRAPTSSRLGGDTAAGLVVTAFGLGYTGVALGIPADTSETSVVGPAVFPLLFGSLLAVGGLALVAGGLRKARRTTARPTTEVAAAPAEASPPASGLPQETPPASRAPRSFWVLIALLAGYAVAFIPVGYLLSTAAFLMALMSYLNPRRLLVNLAFSVLFPVAVYLLFGFGLHITLPAGVLSGVLP
jgi:putative tricarboxylic transport membrane protein